MQVDPQPTPERLVVSIARSPLALAAGISMAMGGLMLAVPVFSLQVFDRVLGSGSRETLLVLLAIACLALLALGLLDMVRTAVLARLSTRLGVRLSGSLLATGAQAGDPGQGLRDLTQVRQALAGPALIAIFDAPWLPLALGLVWLMHPVLGWFGVASALALVVLAVLGDLVARRRLRDANALAPATQRLVDALGRQREVVAAMGLLPNLQARFAQRHDAVLVLQQQAVERGGWVSGAARATRLGIQAGVLSLGALLVLRGELTPGAMIASSILLGRALAPIEQMLVGWRSLAQAGDSWHRLRELLARVPAGPAAMALPPPRGEVILERVAYRAGDRELLRPTTLEIAAGELIGVVGPSAAGKTTLCRLIIGALAPSEGLIRLDGVDIATQSRAVLGPHLGYLPQHTSLFAGTVAENIARLAPSPDPERVVAAARLAGVHELVLHLPAGYDTLLGEEGAPLSAGQRQRIGLARALYGAPRLLVLDEPNAHLDGAGELALSQALETLKTQRVTIVLVTHRLNVLRHADRIVVMDRGGIERVGPRDAVLRNLVRPARVA